MTLARRMALIEAARAHGSLIIEDDYDSEFRRDGPPLPAMQGLVPDAPVVYLGTFSKTLFPALRIGFMVLPKGLVAPFVDMLRQRCPRGRSADQLALAEFLRGGQFAIHLRKMRRLYAQRRDALVAALTQQLGNLVTLYGGSSGIHLTLGLPSSFDDVAISSACAKQQIAVTPLSQLAIGTPLHNGLMLGYAQVPAQDMTRHVAVLARMLKSQSTL
jgi:GntR family transcriptional regulator/MocR family aminotransferase